jgi:hypothetical protein
VTVSTIKKVLVSEGVIGEAGYEPEFHEPKIEQHDPASAKPR